MADEKKAGKKISIVVPCYNEEENVIPLHDALETMFRNELPAYDYEILYIDNCSSDATREELQTLCHRDKHVKAILNAKNFGQFNSPYYGMLQATGDCVVLMAADFQDPVEMVPKFVKEWENGFKIVIGRKTGSKENVFVYKARSVYYKLIKKFSEVEQIEHFTGFGLYDSGFVDVLRDLNDPTPFLRGIVAELGYRRKEIEYTQPQRRAGKTHNNFYSLYDAAMLSFTSYTKIGLRMATFTGLFVGFVSVVIAIVYLVMKLMFWDRFAAGTAPVMIGMFFLGAVQLFFLGFMGEYILSMNQRIMNRPLVIEEKRINFEEEKEEEK